MLQGYADFFWLVILAVPLGLLFLLVSMLLSANITWTRRRLKFLGIFYNLKAREQLWLAVGIVKVLFVASVMFFWVELTIHHICFYGALYVLANILMFKVRRFLMDTINTAAIFVAMVVSNLVSGYYWDVSGDAMIMTVCVLLALFVTMYTLYFYFKDTCDILEYKQVNVQATNLVPQAEHAKEGAKGD
jgi:hypothetical protein